jgi:hypothetical protein
MKSVKLGWIQVRRVCGMLQCCNIVLCYEIIDQNRLVCWSIVVKKNKIVVSPFYEEFPGDRIPKATGISKTTFETNFPHAAIPVIHQGIPGKF